MSHAGVAARRVAGDAPVRGTQSAQTSSAGPGIVDDVNEAHFAEIEKTLLYVSDARERAERAARLLAGDDAEEHLVEALEQTQRELLALHRRLMQATYFAVPKAQLTL